MDSKKTSETLEEGFMESKLSQSESPCNKILEEADSVCLSNLSEKPAADVYSRQSEVSHVELARKIGNGIFEESMVFDDIAGNNQINKGSLNNYPDEKPSVLTHGNDMNNNDVPVLEGDLKFSGNDGIQIGKVDEPPVEKCDDMLHSHELVQVEKIDDPMEKGDHVSHPHEPGSPTKIDVSGNSINLFVEVFGPLNGISGSSDNLNGTGEHNMGESDSKQENSLKENGTVSPGVKDVSAKNEGEDIVGEQECAFDAGDLVWVKTRTQLWWPGMISDPSNAANDTRKCEKRGSFLVKYFGSANFVWCDNSDLKPFLEYFEQMSGQNNSRNFFGSMERALCEIGRRVKSKMTCPCFSKDSQTLDAQWSMKNKEENSMSTKKASKFDVLSLSQFEPATFLVCIKHLARSVHVPGKIELMVMKNRLSSFYCSIGHCELPLQLLRSGSDAAQNTQERLTSEVIDEDHNNISGDGRNSVQARNGDLTVTRRRKKNHSDDGDLAPGDKIASFAKGLESRERKKSKYLSYPYVDVNQGLNVASTLGEEKEDPKHCSSLNAKSTPLGSCSGMSSRKKGTRKPLKGNHIVSKADDINACSAELLAEFCSAARDCFYLSGSKYSDSLKRFYSSFRIFAFLDADIACKDAGEQQAPNLEKRLLENSAEAEVEMEGLGVVKESENQKVNLASVKESVENVVGSKSPKTDNPQAKEHVICRRAKKKKEQATNSQKLMDGIRVVKESENQKVNLASAKESVEHAAGYKFPKTDNPQAKENVISRKAEKKKEHVISAGLESIRNSFSMGPNIYPNGSWMISFQQACSELAKSRTTTKKSERVTHGLANINSIARLPDLNGNLPSFSVEHTPGGGPSTNLGKPLPEQRKEGLVSPNINGVDQIDFTSVSSSNDAPVTLQSAPQSNNGVNGANQCQINTGLSSFVQHSLQMGIFPSAGKAEPKKRKRKEKTSQVASVIPDLNGNVSDMSSSGKSMPEGSQISPEGEPPKKRGNKSACNESGPSGEALGGSLLLNFAPGFTLPSKETLIATFSRFGLLKESEVQVLSDSTIHIVYERSSDARFAFRSLEKSHTFGESLVGFKLHCTPAPSRIKKKKKLQMLQTFVPVDASKNPTKPGETPDIAFIRQNVEMMKSTLEKAGDNLSPEMRAKLENEIKVFLDKISSTTGSSSS